MLSNNHFKYEVDTLWFYFILFKFFNKKNPYVRYLVKLFCRTQILPNILNYPVMMQIHAETSKCVSLEIIRIKIQYKTLYNTTQS